LRRLVEYLADRPAADDGTELEELGQVDAIVRTLHAVHRSRTVSAPQLGDDQADAIVNALG
jgi:hypothetical protein